MGFVRLSACGFEANRPSISRLALGCRFGGLGKSQPAGGGRVVNRNEEAGLLLADQVTHKDDSCDDEDNERKKR
jgi:hypothetical protein